MHTDAFVGGADVNALIRDLWSLDLQNGPIITLSRHAANVRSVRS